MLIDPRTTEREPLRQQNRDLAEARSSDLNDQVEADGGEMNFPGYKLFVTVKNRMREAGLAYAADGAVQWGRRGSDYLPPRGLQVALCAQAPVAPRFVVEPRINPFLHVEALTLSRPVADARRWSQEVTRTSNALDLEPGVFTWPDPAAIARSLKESAERSTRRRADPFRSAMSMLNFFINRAGTKLDPAQRERLEAAKDELRALYGRPRRAARV